MSRLASRSAIVLCVLTALFGIRVGRKVHSKRQPFSAREALSAAWVSRLPAS